MKNIKEILRLASDANVSVRQIAKSCNCSPTTVSAVIERAKTADLTLDWPMINQMSGTNFIQMRITGQNVLFRI